MLVIHTIQCHCHIAWLCCHLQDVLEHWLCDGTLLTGSTSGQFWITVIPKSHYFIKIKIAFVTNQHCQKHHQLGQLEWLIVVLKNSFCFLWGGVKLALQHDFLTFSEIRADNNSWLDWVQLNRGHLYSHKHDTGKVQGAQHSSKTALWAWTSVKKSLLQVPKSNVQTTVCKYKL